MTTALIFLVLRLLRRSTSHCQRLAAALIFRLHPAVLIPYPVRNRGRLDSTGSP
jgi:hypothetical protein